MERLVEQTTSLALLVGHCIQLFITRHWLLAVVSVTLTVLLGLGILNFTRRFFRLSAPIYLTWLRLVLLGALFKGAFYLVIGDNRRENDPVVAGIQVPDPIEFLRLVPQSRDSVWQPTEAMIFVSGIMCSIAVYLLAKRAYGIVKATKALANISHLSSEPQPRINTALRNAATALGFRPNATLPTVLLVNLQYATPMLLGVLHPTLLLSPKLAERLSDRELEALLRHELAHLKRRDHWWRWLILWVQDVGRPNFLSSYLVTEAVALEEQLCDRMAARDSAEALDLANAVIHARNAIAEDQALSSWSPAPILPQEVVPALLGNFVKPQFEAESLRKRMETIANLATELNTDTTGSQARLPFFTHLQPVTRFVRSVGLFVLKFSIFLVVYLKFIFVVSLSHLW